MLTLYQARENIDKERFVYEQIQGESLVLVPNQYTLVAEEQALKYMSKDCLFDVEVLSMNRLGLRILSEQGRESVKLLDRYGRFMLLNKIVREHRSELDIYSRAAGKLSFTSMLNDFIADFKQQNCSIEMLKEMLAGGNADELLSAKLSELQIIIDEYERALEGRYLDSEDYVARYVAEIKNSEFIRNKEIWIYGYDTITPKFSMAMFELAKRARAVNFIVNQSDYGMDEELVRLIIAKSNELDVDLLVQNIPESYTLVKSETIKRIERGLFNDQLPEEELKENARFVPGDLRLVRASNPYSEAETAAAYTYQLIRDCGYRMRDIQIIANNEETLHPIIKRSFEEYGLDVFEDSSRRITNTAPVGFIVNLLLFAGLKDGSKHLFAMLKTGLAGVPYEQIEALENYARVYKIKGSMWNRAFKYGEEQLGEAFFALEELRVKLSEAVLRLEQLAEGCCVRDFVAGFKSYLEDEWQLSERLESSIEEQIRMNCLEQAQMDSQAYGKALELLDQMVEILGDEELSLIEFTDILNSGLADVELGVIPPTVDGLSIGTMIRTRPRPSKAVIVIGANEGVLPMQSASEGLFSMDELQFFRDEGFAIGLLDDIKLAEENVAMYRMLSKPSEKLYISYSMTDADGKDTEPSMLLDSMLELFPRVKDDGLIEQDIISAGWDAVKGEAALNDRINAGDESLRHLVNHLKDRNTPRQMDAQTEALLAWFERNRPRDVACMLRVAQDENENAPLGRKLAAELFARRDGNVVLSASSINSYFSCPFKFFVERGLRPSEERSFAGDARSIGDVYHECLMMIARRIMADREYGRKLAECSVDELEEMIRAELDAIAESYNGGLFISCSNEEFHLERIKEICANAAQAMARQLAGDSVLNVYAEERFGRGCEFKPVEFDIDGQRVYVEGTIDRADELVTDGESKRIRIVDYKTGSDKLDKHKMANGYKMQLMIYMLSASNEYEPAGMFYFNIKDQIADYNNVNENTKKVGDGYLVEQQPSDFFKLRGLYVDEPGVLEAMPAEALGSVKSKLNREEFDELKESVRSNIEAIAGGIVDGKIPIRPFKENSRLVCGYCQYRSICKRDREFAANSAWEIPPAPGKKKEK